MNAFELRSQVTKAGSIKIAFKANSVKISKSEKERIKKFISENRIDSNFTYRIEWFFEGCFPKKSLTGERVFNVKEYLLSIGVSNEMITIHSSTYSLAPFVNIDIIQKETSNLINPPLFHIRKESKYEN